MGRSVTRIDGLSVCEWGNPQGPEIVFVHGIMQSQQAFIRQRDGLLASQYRMVSYDLRGHGLSNKPKDRARYSGTAHAQDLQRVLVAKGLARPVLVGWSLGARLIAEYVGLFGWSRLGGVNFVGMRAVHGDDASTRGPASRLIARMTAMDEREREAAGDAFLKAQVHKSLSEANYAFMQDYTGQCPQHVRAACLEWTRDYVPNYEIIKVPILVIHGLEDAVAAPARIPEFAAQLGAQLRLYSDVGHMPFWEDAARYNADLSLFINGLEPVRR